MTEERRRALSAIVAQDPRWYQLGQEGSRLLAELNFPDSLSSERDRLLVAAQDLGFEAGAHRRMVRAMEPLADPLGLTIEAPFPLTELIKGTPSELRLLRLALRSNLPRASMLAPELLLLWRVADYG